MEASFECKICGRHFKHLGSHVAQTHKVKAREYKQRFGLDVKKGLVTHDIKEKQRKHTLENGTIENLKLGEEFRFRKGQVPKYKRSKETLERLKTQSAENIKKTRFYKIHEARMNQMTIFLYPNIFRTLLKDEKTEKRNIRQKSFEIWSFPHGWILVKKNERMRDDSTTTGKIERTIGGLDKSY